MLCKKCGANISDKAKFCTSCGSEVENIEYYESTIKTIENQEENLNQNNQFEETVIVPPISKLPSNQSNKKNKRKTCIFIVCGIILVVFALILIIYSFNKSYNSSIKILEKAINNFEENGENSGTINAEILMESNENSYNLSANIKYMKNIDSYDMALILNKSILSDEINLYLNYTDENMTLYTKSNLIDILGGTSSQTDMWVYYLMNLNDLELDEVMDIECDLSKVLDNQHYKFIGIEDTLKHYQLIIDNKLINKIKAQLDLEDLKKLENSLSIFSTNEKSELINSYYVDIYINELGNFEKISVDFKETINNLSFTKVIINFEFANLGNTYFEIPSDIKSSAINLKTYMSTYYFN